MRHQDGGFPSQCGPLGERAYESAAGMKAGTVGNGFDQWTVIQKYWITVPDELGGFSYSKNSNTCRDEPDS
jgi:hypothetical protein